VAITLEEIQLQARQRADMVNSEFISDGELTSYINNSISELYDILCEAYSAEYYVTSEEGTTVTDQADYDLPSDFYELKAVDIKLDNATWVNVARFNFNERNWRSDTQPWTIAGVANVRYRLVGNQLKFSPAPDGGVLYRVWYVPVATKLVNPTDELDDLNAYSEYVIVDAAIKMMQKEESDVSVLLLQKQALEKRIRDKSQNRDAAQAGTISDVTLEASNYWWPSE